MKKSFNWVILCVLVLGLAAAGHAADPQPQYGGEMIYAIGSEPHSLFPGRELGSNEAEVWLYTYDNLVELNEDGKIVPWLAKSWEFSGDRKICTMHLQEGVKFTDGTPFNAEVVKFIFDEIIAKTYITANMLTGLSKIEAKDEHTVAFYFEYPLAPFITNLAHRSFAIWNPTVYKKNGPEWMGTHMVGTGPFILEEWRHGEYIRFKKNPDYWKKGLPYLVDRFVNVFTYWLWPLRILSLSSSLD